MAHPILDRLSEPKVRWWIAGGVVLLALAVGGFTLAGRAGTDARAGEGPGLNIAVVAPTEPDVQPGEVMDVGRLNDGFDGRLPERIEQASGDTDLYAEQPAYVEADQGWRIDDSSGNYVRPGPEGDPYQRRRQADDGSYGDARAEKPGAQREAYQERSRERPMSFGFDRPQPDWRAEREARRVALEARERERNARPDRRYRSSGDRSGLSQDSEFY